MANPWFRLHSDILSNRKLLRLTHAEQRHYIWLLALKSNGVLDDYDASSSEDTVFLEKLIAHELWISLAKTRKLKQKLVAANLIDAQWQPIGWNERQYLDSPPAPDGKKQPMTGAERVRRHRERQACVTHVTDDVTNVVTENVTCVTDDVTNSVTENVTEVTLSRARETDTDIQITEEQITPPYPPQGGDGGQAEKILPVESQEDAPVQAAELGQVVDLFSAEISVENTGKTLTEQSVSAESLVAKLEEIAAEPDAKPSPVADTIQLSKPPKFRLPDWVPKDLWDGFEEMRKKRKKHLTDRARQMAIDKLKALVDEEHDVVLVMEQTILHAWDTFYPLRPVVKPKEESTPWECAI